MIENVTKITVFMNEKSWVQAGRHPGRRDRARIVVDVCAKLLSFLHMLVYFFLISLWSYFTVIFCNFFISSLLAMVTVKQGRQIRSLVVDSRILI